MNIEHGVQLGGIGSEQASYRGDLVTNEDVATIELKYLPRQGSILVHNVNAVAPEAPTTWVLDALIEDNGYSRRYVVRKQLTP